MAEQFDGISLDCLFTHSGYIAFPIQGAAASRTFLDVAQKELPNGAVGLPAGAFEAALDGPNSLGG